jgi:hypothetical protein
LLGNRKANIKLANKLFATQNTVNFVKVSEPLIEQLINGLRELKIVGRKYYEQDSLLLEEIDLFTKSFQRIVGVIQDYSTYIHLQESIIIRFFKFTSVKIYKELFESKIKPILRLLKQLKNEVRKNAYLEKLEEILKDNIEKDNIYIITKHHFMEETIQVADKEIKVLRGQDFINTGIFADHLFFIGTPSYYDRIFSEIFYSKKTTFLGYSCFENNIVKKNTFSNLINEQQIINTNYKDVELNQGFKGINYKKEIEKPILHGNEKIVEEIEKKSDVFGEKVFARFAIISNNYSIFIPVGQKVNMLDRETLKVSPIDTKQLLTGDLLVFRSQNGSTLIREVADQIIGEKATYYRDNIERWKRKLNYNVEKKGLSKVSKILIKKYGISTATENNIKNWISPYSIKPKYLDKMLDIFRFSEKEKNEIILSAKYIVRGHISAGHKISQSLMAEINTNLENSLDEKGYYKFESKIFAGASFNIEEIKQISDKNYLVPEQDVLKIFKTLR